MIVSREGIAMENMERQTDCSLNSFSYFASMAAGSPSEVLNINSIIKEREEKDKSQYCHICCINKSFLSEKMRTIEYCEFDLQRKTIYVILITKLTLTC